MRLMLLSALAMLAMACSQPTSSTSTTPTPMPAAPDPSTPVVTPPPTQAATARDVGACSECGAGEACVERVTMTGPKRSCAPIAAACPAGAATCECMRTFCPEPYDTCNMNGAVVTCSCPAC